MTKKFLSAILCLTLVLALPLGALAAPVREERGMDVPGDEGLRGFLSTVMSAAMLKDLPVLGEGEIPSQGLTEAVMAVFEYNMFGLDSVTLSAEDCAGLYRGFFAAGEFTMPEKGDCPCVRVENGKMVMDLAELNETPLVGAHVYEAALRDGRVFLKADLYTAWGYYLTPAPDIPEEDLTWYAGAEICAEAGEGELFGWRLVSYRIGEVWRDGALGDWTDYENGEDGYTLRVPSRFGLSEKGEGVRQWQTPDGEATLTIRKLPAMTFAEGLRMMETGSGLLTPQEEFSCVLMTGEENSLVLVCGEGLEAAWLATLEYPSGKAEEYTFYAEIIRNSLNVRGLANG